MIRMMIESMLGEVGRQILYYYEAHATPINLTLLTYGLIMLGCWLTFTRIYQRLVIMVVEEIQQNNKLNQNSSIKSINKAIQIPWKKAIDTARFPLIAGRAGLIPFRKSVARMKKMVTAEEVITHAKAVIEGENPRRILPVYKSVFEERMGKSKKRKK